MQNKAPIRSQTLGPERSGNAGVRPTGQRQGSSANPNTGQIGPTFEAYFGLSVSTISFATHRAAHAVSGQLALEFVTRVLGGFNWSSQHLNPEGVSWVAHRSGYNS
ncbi:hypothetical protein GD429_25765 [Burkholderia sp. BE17]|nr:hypothetical protein [Burkholderia sp. BE17]